MDRRLLFLGLSFLAGAAAARTVNISNSSQYLSAINAALPGDTLLLAAGNYAPDDPPASRDGTLANPVVVRGTPGATVNFMTTGEGIWHYPKYWTYENIRFNAGGGVHSFHIKPGAKGYITWRNCHWFNCIDKAIKVDGDFSGAAGLWTDYLLVENCTMVVGQAGLMNNDGGDYCTCRNNYTYGFVDGGVNYIYFSKGGHAYTIFENNLVNGGRRGAISLGGGSMGASKFRHDDDLASAYPDATMEMINSVMRNNIVLNATEGAFSSSTTLNCEVYNNTAINCGYGLWVEAHHGSPVGLKWYNNLLISTGGVRNGGSFVTQSNNTSLTSAPTVIFQDYRASDLPNSDFRIKTTAATPVGKGRAPYANNWNFYALPSSSFYDYYGTARPNPPTIGATEVYGNDEIQNLPEKSAVSGVDAVVTPNPATGPIRISLSSDKARPLADVLVWDAAGRHVRTVYYGPLPKGETGLAWDRRSHGGQTMPAGTYVLRVSLGKDILYRKFQILR